MIDNAALPFARAYICLFPRNVDTEFSMKCSSQVPTKSDKQPWATVRLFSDCSTGVEMVCQM